MDALAVALRFGLYLDLMLLFGTGAFALYALRGAERASGAVLPLFPLLLSVSFAALPLSALGLLVLAANMAGTPLFPVDNDTLGVVLWETAIGTAWMVRIAALAATALAVVTLHRAPLAVSLVAASGGALALATLAWSGHGAMEGAGGWLHLAADIAHLLAAGLWIGALFCLGILVFAPSTGASVARLQLAHRALAGFAPVGSMAVAMLVATGIANTFWILGWAGLTGLPGTRYGQLLIAKLLLFAAMLGLAASNRWRLVPRLESGLTASPLAPLAALRRSLALEALAGAAIVALVAWLGTLDPGGAAQ